MYKHFLVNKPVPSRAKTQKLFSVASSPIVTSLAYCKWVDVAIDAAPIAS